MEFQFAPWTERIIDVITYFIAISGIESIGLMSISNYAPNVSLQLFCMDGKVKVVAS